MRLVVNGAGAAAVSCTRLYVALGVYEDTTKWWNKGDKWEDYVVEVVGHGINKKTGEPINFVGKQTGF